LEEYDGPGAYGRSDWKVDAEKVYQRLNNGRIICWLNEAAGASPVMVRVAILDMARNWNGSKQREAKIARFHFPWEKAAGLLFK
jgi:hypothetical protein